MQLIEFSGSSAAGERAFFKGPFPLTSLKGGFSFLATRERIGILTAGGDCPGLNAVIRAVVRRALSDEVEVLGIKNGWRGLVENDVEPLTRASVTGILPRGGTILGTSRLNPTDSPQTIELVKQNWHKFELRATIVVGGEGSLSAALDLWRNHDLKVVGVPKTIDNDVRGTDFTF